MIEQTEMTVIKWHFHLLNITDNPGYLSNATSIEVMKKRNAIKKGIACRFTCQFVNGKEPILDYVAEHSYVIDFNEIIDKNELLKMFRNSFANFEEKFEFRKTGTILQNEKLRPLDESLLNLEPILPLLI